MENKRDLRLIVVEATEGVANFHCKVRTTKLFGIMLQFLRQWAAFVISVTHPVSWCLMVSPLQRMRNSPRVNTCYFRPQENRSLVLLPPSLPSRCTEGRLLILGALKESELQKGSAPGKKIPPSPFIFA